MDSVTRTLFAAFETLQVTTLEPGAPPRRLSKGQHSSSDCWAGPSGNPGQSSLSRSSNFASAHLSSPTSKRKRGLHAAYSMTDDFGGPPSSFHSSSSESLNSDYAVKSRRLATGLSMYFTDSLNLRAGEDQTREEAEGEGKSLSNGDRMSGSHLSVQMPVDSRSSSLDVSHMISESSSMVIPVGSVWHGTDNTTIPWSKSPPTLGFSPPRLTTCHQHDFEKQQRAQQILQDLETIVQSSSNLQILPNTTHFAYLSALAFRQFIDTKRNLYQSDLRVNSTLWSQTEFRRTDIGRLIESAFKKLVETCKLLLESLEKGLEEHGRQDMMEPSGSLDDIMEQVHVLLQTCGDISILFHSPFPKLHYTLISRLAHSYLCYLLSLFDQIKSQLVVSEAKLMQLFQSGIQVLKALGRLSDGPWIPFEPLERVILELGLGLCEQTGSLWEHGKRSRTMLMMHLIGRYIRSLLLLGTLGEDEKKRILHLIGQLPDH